MVTRPGLVIILEFFSFNLTVSEMLFGIANIISFIHLFHCISSLHQALSFFSGFLFVGRPLFQTCICVERYLAVIHPVLFLRLKPLKYKLVGCAVVWLLVLIFCFTLAFMTKAMLFNLQSCIISFYLLLCLVKLFCCLSVFWALKKPGPGEGGREREQRDDLKMKAFKVILIITVCTVMTYTPFVLIFILQNYIEFQEAYVACVSIAVMTGFVYPFLYLHRTGKLPASHSDFHS
ncbi:hypothetical protein LDENG_00124930 [Lucifuga dentata]|nr:hypothetical protein LDENG_00124930 [Lucifuga dentata]